MGNCLGPNVRDEPALWDKWCDVLCSLNFTRVEFRRLLAIYQKIDKDNSGHINLKELLLFLKMENDEFMRRTFSIFDDDKSGEIDFGEFVVALWNYCTETNTSLILFAFDLYDNDGSGVISRDEIKRLLSDIYGASLTKNRFVKHQTNNILNAADKVVDERSEGMTYQDFTKLTRMFPNLLFATFEVHSAIQQKILGHSFWEHLSQKSLSDPHGKSISLVDFKLAGYHRKILQECAVKEGRRKSVSAGMNYNNNHGPTACDQGPGSRKNSISSDNGQQARIVSMRKQVDAQHRIEQQQLRQQQQQESSSTSMSLKVPPLVPRNQQAWDDGYNNGVGGTDVRGFADDGLSGKLSARSNVASGKSKATENNYSSPFSGPKSNQVYPTTTPSLFSALNPFQSPALTSPPLRNRPQPLQPISLSNQIQSPSTSKPAAQGNALPISIASATKDTKSAPLQPVSDTQLWTSGKKDIPKRNAAPAKSGKDKLVIEDFEEDY